MTYRKIMMCIFMCPRPGLYIRCYTDKIRFLGLSLTWSKKKRKFSSWQWKLEKFVDVVECWFMNLDMVKPGKYDHPHLFYHFTITLRLTIWLSSFWFIILEEDVVTRNIVTPVCFACKPFELLKLCFFLNFD